MRPISSPPGARHALAALLLLAPLAACGDASAPGDADTGAVDDADASGPGCVGPAPAWTTLVSGGTSVDQVLALDDGGLILSIQTTEDQRPATLLTRLDGAGHEVWRGVFARVHDVALDGDDDLVAVGVPKDSGAATKGLFLRIDRATGAETDRIPFDFVPDRVRPRAADYIVTGRTTAGLFTLVAVDDDAAPIAGGPTFTVDDGDPVIDVVVSDSAVAVATHAVAPSGAQRARLRLLELDGALRWERLLGDGFCNTAFIGIEPHPRGGVAVLVTSDSVDLPGTYTLARLDANGALVWRRVLDDPGKLVFGAASFANFGDGFVLAGAHETPGPGGSPLRYRWAALYDEAGRAFFSEVYTHSEGPVVSAIALRPDLSLVLAGLQDHEAGVLVTAPFAGCPAPEGASDDLACDRFEDAHQVGVLSTYTTLTWSCGDRQQQSIVFDAGTDTATVCAGGGAVFPALPAGLALARPPSRVYPTMSFAAPATVRLWVAGLAAGVDPSRLTLLHDTLDGQGWRAIPSELVRFGGQDFIAGQTTETGVFALATEAAP